MPLTADEIRHLQLRRTWLPGGFRRSVVLRVHNEIADTLAEVWGERADLKDRVEELEADASKHRELEALLRSTLVSAERAAQDVKEQARRESDLIVQEAHAESRRITREVAAEKRRLEEDMIKIRAQLRAALESLGDSSAEKQADEQEAGEEEGSQTRPAIGEVTDPGIRKVAG